MLYGLMLDRMSLSVKNQWMDEEGRAYIYYSLEDIMDALGCSNKKAISIMKELDMDAGIGLIEKKRQGQGKPTMIYLKQFMIQDVQKCRNYTSEEKSVISEVKVIDREGLPDVVFHSLRHTSVTYKLKLSGGDIKAVQGDSGHAQADMVTEVYGHILDEDRKKNAQLIEDAFYKKENLNPDMKQQDSEKKKIEVPDGIDAEALMKVLNNPEMAALLAGLARV